MFLLITASHPFKLLLLLSPAPKPIDKPVNVTLMAPKTAAKPIKTSLYLTNTEVFKLFTFLVLNKN